MSKEIQKIPEKVIEMAKFIEDCNKANQEYIIIQGRRSGLTMAQRLATQTEDADFEIIDSKTNQ